MGMSRAKSWKGTGLWVWLLVVSAIAACLLALQATPANSQTVTLTVDDNGAQCPDAEYTTIQAAVNAADPDTRIIVCAGTYEEQITVGAGKNDLVLDGSGRGSTTIKAPDALTGAGDIITVTRSRRVQIQDFEISGPLPITSCSPEYLSGIRVYGGGSANIANNLITGIRSESVDLRGCQNGFGIVFGDYDSGTELATSGDGTVVGNTIDRYQKGGIVVSEDGSNVAVRDNNISGVGETENIAQNGIQVSYGGEAVVRLNNIKDHVYTGAQDNLYDAGGILLASRPSNDSLVGNNTVSGNDYNIGLFNASGILFRNNLVTRSKDLAGIFVNAQSRNNLFEDNRALNNQRFDCRDRSEGTRTAGTANTWTDNVGEIDRPDGICPAP